MKCDYDHESQGDCSGEVSERETMTKYGWNGEGKDPNAVCACDRHYEEYVDHWTEMWREYWSSVL